MNKQRLFRLLKIKKAQLSKYATPDYFYILASGMIVAGVAIRIATHTSQLISPLIDKPSSQIAYAQAVITPSPKPTPSADWRVELLEKKLNKHNSPLADYAAYIVEQSDLNAIEWTLIVGISSMESSYGKNCPAGSHNAWGITKAGKEGTIRYFNTWEEGIAFEAKLLGEHYRLQANDGIRSKYCPTASCNQNWANTVTSVSQDILAMRGGDE